MAQENQDNQTIDNKTNNISPQIWFQMWPRIGSNISPVQTRPSSVQSRIDTIKEVPVIKPERTKPFDTKKLFNRINTRVWFGIESPVWIWSAQQWQTSQQISEQMPMVEQQISDELGQLSEKEVQSAKKMKNLWLTSAETANFIKNERELWQLDEEEIELAKKLRNEGKSPLETSNILLERRWEQAQLDDTMWAIWWWLAGVAWLWWLTTLWAKWMQRLGKFIYWLNIRPDTAEATRAQAARAAWTKPPRWVVDTALESWNPFSLTFTRKQIGDMAKKRAGKIFSETINPILEKADEVFNFNEILDEVQKQISEEGAWQLRKKDLMEWLDALKQDYADIWVNNMSLEQLQQEKSTLDEFTSAKVFKWKDVVSAYNTVKNRLANVIRKKIHETIKNNYGVDSAKLYQDYANLNKLSKLWVDARIAWGLKWWSGRLTERIIDTLLTPITSIVGKGTYRLWKGIDITPTLQKAANKAKDIFSNPKNIKSIAKWILSPVNVIEPTWAEIINNIDKSMIEDLLDRKGLYSDISDAEYKQAVENIDLDKEVQRDVLGIFMDYLFAVEPEELKDILDPEDIEKINSIKNAISMWEPRIPNTTLSAPDEIWQ